jgi:uncharacterized membrane protein YbaN (DUF454 family)
VRPFYLSLAAVFFLLAALGAVLPVLPTTPFLLLTSWCLVRSSPGLNDRLKRSALFGPLLRDWEEHHGVRLHVKVSALCIIATAVTASIAFGNLGRTLTVVLLVLAGAGVVVILRLRTIRDGAPGS